MPKKKKLKPVADQVIVITGASSGIGLTTARRAASRGARVVLAARNAPVLQQLVDEIRGQGGQAVHVEVDVASASDVRRIADAAIDAFGRIDTWVNNAGVSVYGELAVVPEKDARRVFETNFWGVVHGSLVALEHLRGDGGALINIGSTLSDRAVPLQGFYSASKHAVKGFTDALRMELEAAEAPVAVTLIKPAAIDTPYSEHAGNYLGVEAKNPPPVYAPELVADAILHAAEHPTRDLYVGGAAKMLASSGRIAPAATDRYMERTMFSGQRSSTPHNGDARGSLYATHSDARERGRAQKMVFERSLYTAATKHPLRTAIVAAGLAVGVGALLRASK